jgi:predicted DNA-binding ribbon-helix-helix protein
MSKPRNSTLIIKYIRYDDRPTSMALEQEFWDFLGEIATEKHVPISRLVSAINSTKGMGVSLASAIRVFVAQHYRGEP